MMSYDTVLDGHILNIVQNQDVHEQLDLQNYLKDRGYDIPQATLSRRLKKLKIAKVAGIYKVVDLNIPNLPLVLNIQVSEFGLIVLHTHPGNASSLAYYIDQKWVAYQPHSIKRSGILGTIAGDDTVILIIESKTHLKQVLALLHEEFPYMKLPD
jgi:transcriptional regulator of arginine metabolism